MSALHPPYTQTSYGFPHQGLPVYGVPGPLAATPVPYNQHTYPDGSREMSYQDMMMANYGPGLSKSQYPMGYQVEHSILPDFYTSLSAADNVIFIEKLTTKDLVPVRKMLPYVLKEDEMMENWEEWSFDSVGFDVTPEEAPYRLTQFTKAAYSVKFNRRARGFSNEITSLKTRQGQEERMYKMEQLTEGLAETNCREAVNACLNAIPSKPDTYNTMHNVKLTKEQYLNQVGGAYGRHEGQAQRARISRSFVRSGDCDNLALDRPEVALSARRADGRQLRRFAVSGFIRPSAF